MGSSNRHRFASAARLSLAALFVLALGNLHSVAVAADEVFVSDYATNKVSVFLRTANGDLAPIRTIQTEVQHPHGIRIDPIRQEIFVPLNLANAVKVYDAGANYPNDAPKRTIAGALTLINRPVGTAVDTVHQELYVTSDVVGASFITVYPLLGNGNIAPIRTLGGPLTGIDGPNGIVVDVVHDELYIVSYRTGFGGSIAVFPRTASGNVSPIRVIQGANTTFNRPQELSVDLTNNELIVVNSAFSTSSPGSVLTFSRLDAGDVSPLRQISGSNTQLCTPIGLSVDVANNEIFVANGNFFNFQCPALVTVYSRTANGNIAPIRQIGPGPVSGFIEPVSVTVRRSVDCSGAPDGMSCDDGNACTQIDSCLAGVCNGTTPVTCTALDQCHDAGVCNTATGACSNPAKADGTACSDSNACTQTDSCQAGVCTGSSPVNCPASDLCHLPGVCDTGTGVCGPSEPVVCTALDSCHLAGVCDLGTGVCSNPTEPDGTGCNDGNLCTTGETCHAGSCVGGTTICTDLVAAYGFEEGSGSSVLDSSGNGNTGTLAGATRTPSGKYGKALSFNGTNALVSVDDSDSLDLTTQMTLEAWVNPSSLGSWRDVIYKGPTDTYYLEGSSDPSSRPATGGSFAGGGPLFGTAALPLNTWSHLAATYDGITLILYVNGTLVASRAQTGAIQVSTGSLTIGGDPMFGQYWAGLIDEVRIYKRALSVAEIITDRDTPVGSGNSQPDLALTKTHAGNFVPGQTGATYTLTVTNVGTGPTVGAVTVTDTLPNGLSATAIGGTNWICTLPAGPCSTNDALIPTASFPPLTLTVNVAANAPSSVTNTATVSGGGDTNPANDTANDVTLIGDVATGLVASYAFEEGIGSSVLDSSGFGNTGTIAGATRTTSGKYGSALSFNGTNAMVSVNDAPSLDLTTGMTLEAWVNPSTVTPVWRDIIYKGPNDNYYLEGSSDQSSRPAAGGSFVSGPVFGPAALPLSTWSHLAATYDGATLMVYVNGAQVGSVVQVGAIAVSTGPLTIGGDPAFGQHWAGLIDEVHIFNRALGPGEIQQDMMAPAICGIGAGFLRLGPAKDAISWPNTVLSGPFDLVKGDLLAVRSSGGDFSGSVCLENNLTATTTTDPTAPAPGGATYYLIRCDGGTWADGTQVGNRGATLSACP